MPWRSPTARCPSTSLASKSTGPQTLVVHLHAPTPYLLALLTNAYLYPLYEPAMKQWGDALDAARAHGFERAFHAVRPRFERAHHADEKSLLLGCGARAPDAGELLSILDDDAAAMNQYLAGDLDFTDRFSMSRQRTAAADRWADQLVLAPDFATAMFGFNLTKPPFAGNPKLRLALNVALDRDILVNYVQHGIGVPAYNIMPPLNGYDPAVPDWAKLSDDARHALARKLYQEAGYSTAIH